MFTANRSFLRTRCYLLTSDNYSFASGTANNYIGSSIIYILTDQFAVNCTQYKHMHGVHVSYLQLQYHLLLQTLITSVLLDVFYANCIYCYCIHFVLLRRLLCCNLMQKFFLVIVVIGNIKNFCTVFNKKK